MGRKKRTTESAAAHESSTNGGNAKKLKQLDTTGEIFMVKKYRADRVFVSMEAFVRYAKAHRMLDASYVRWNVGVTVEKPHVFSVRVGGTDLGWGRGTTREAAMDCAVRAAFALVNAHGYKNFQLDADCLLQAPVDDFVPPPPPPPPLPSGYPPPPPPPMLLTPPGVYSLPPPVPPGVLLPPPPPPPINISTADIIPQPKLSQQAPVASSLHRHPAMARTMPSETNTTTMNPASSTPAVISLNFSTTAKQHQNVAPPVTATTALPIHGSSVSNTISLRQLKGGLVLVFDPTGEGRDELCMSELRVLQPRYQKMLIRAAIAAKSSTPTPLVAG